MSWAIVLHQCSSALNLMSPSLTLSDDQMDRCLSFCSGISLINKTTVVVSDWRLQQKRRSDIRWCRIIALWLIDLFSANALNFSRFGDLEGNIGQ